MLSLRAEIAACLFAVSLLGLLAGWMMQRARSTRHLRHTVGALEDRHAAAEKSAQQDVVHLENQLQEFGHELRVLGAENRELRASSQGEQTSLDDVRAEALEQNRLQVETRERLQRIIREREREIATLRAGLLGPDTSSGAEPSPTEAANTGTRFGVADRGRSGKAPARGAPGGQASGSDAVAEGLDATVRIDPALLPVQRAKPTATDERVSPDVTRDGVTAHVAEFDDTLESTVDVAFLDAEEATIALDEEALSLVRGERER